MPYGILEEGLKTTMSWIKECRTEHESFLDSAANYLTAAEHLSKLSMSREKVIFAYYMYPSAVLYCHGTELYLKALCIWEHKGYLKEHDLIKTVKKLEYNIDSNKIRDIKILNEFYKYRYPLSEKEQRKIKNALGTNSTLLAGEISSQELTRFFELIVYLISISPPDFKNSNNLIFKRLSEYFTLT